MTQTSAHHSCWSAEHTAHSTQITCWQCVLWAKLLRGEWRIVTYWLTYCMVQSPSWEANWFAASQEIPRISRNPKIHYRTHKRPPPVSIPGQPNPVHTSTSHLLEIHPNIIHLSTPRSPQWSPSLRFPQQNPIHPPLLIHTRHMGEWGIGIWNVDLGHLSTHTHCVGWKLLHAGTRLRVN